MSFETVFRRAGGEADEIYMNSAAITCRVSDVSLKSSKRFLMSMLAICVGLPLSGCAMGNSGRELAVSDEGVKQAMDHIQERERIKKLRADAAQPKNCYAAEAPTRKVPDSVFRAYDSAASKSTGGVWKREYGSGGGGGGGGGGEGPAVC